jgi:acyl-CoA thioesterase FadM
VLLDISRIGNSSVSWEFAIFTALGDQAAIGSVTTVRVDHEGKPQPISDAERAVLERRPQPASSHKPG